MKALSWLTALTLLGTAAWTLPALRRQSFRDPMRLHLFASTLLLGLGNLVSRPSVIAGLDGVVVTGTAKLTYNVMILVGLSLMVTFLRERPIIRWRASAQWQIGLCAACVAGMTLVTASIPSALRNHTLGSPYLEDSGVRAFYTLGNLYLLVGYGACAVLAWRHSRRGSRPMRVALGTISLGLWALALSCVGRLVWVHVAALRRPGSPVDYSLDLMVALVGTIAVCAGLTLPGLCSVASMLRDVVTHRAEFGGLEELWRRMVEAHPDLMLHGAARRRAWSLSGYALATYRRYVECRDGLIRLAPFLALDEEPLDVAGPPEAAAGVIERALARAAAHGPHPVPAPTSRTGPMPVAELYQDDLTGLVRISAAMAERRVAAADVEAQAGV